MTITKPTVLTDVAVVKYLHLEFLNSMNLKEYFRRNLVSANGAGVCAITRAENVRLMPLQVHPAPATIQIKLQSLSKWVQT